MPDSRLSELAGFACDGCAIIERVLSAGQVGALVEVTRELSRSTDGAVLRQREEVYGVRDLIWRVPKIRVLAESPEVLEIVRAILGPGAFVVRGLFFDKTLEANWNLPWHQDLTIAVQERKHVPGFGPWTVKAGIPHVHAPSELLERMVTIRLHLDDCDLENGPMRVLPGSHLAGKLDAAAIARRAVESRERALDCVIGAGGAIVMRPLLLHCSASRTRAGHRRVIHLEYAAEGLPAGLKWYDRAEPHAFP
jgi:ectoine hydroxylase-related dioxygenase (phytanoyl-CoA dioxygenase family)